MIGKKNVVFGLVFLIFTAALGPLMVKNIYGVVAETDSARKQKLSELNNMVVENYSKGVEDMTTDEIAKAAVGGLIALNGYIVTRQEKVNDIKAQPHAHGNLESLLNIVVGVLLCFLSVGRLFKQLISWIFILGTVLHSGMLYLSTLMLQVLGMTPDASLYGIVNTILGTGAGPLLLLAGLALTALAAIGGFRGEIVRD